MENQEEKLWWCNECGTDLSECKCEVSIKLEKKLIPVIEGAMELGIYVEGICANLLYLKTRNQSYKSDQRWYSMVAYTMDTIVKQTKVIEKFRGRVDEEGIFADFISIYKSLEYKK